MGKVCFYSISPFFETVLSIWQWSVKLCFRTNFAPSRTFIKNLRSVKTRKALFPAHTQIGTSKVGYCHAHFIKHVLFFDARFYVEKSRKINNIIITPKKRISKFLPLRFRKAGRVWCGGARETLWATCHNRVTPCKTKEFLKCPCFSRS